MSRISRAGSVKSWGERNSVYQRELVLAREFYDG